MSSGSYSSNGRMRRANSPFSFRASHSIAETPSLLVDIAIGTARSPPDPRSTGVNYAANTDYEETTSQDQDYGTFCNCLLMVSSPSNDNEVRLQHTISGCIPGGKGHQGVLASKLSVKTNKTISDRVPFGVHADM